MSEAHDSLEAELAALRPHDASPELRQSIADQRNHLTPTRSRWGWGLVLASGLAAAGVAAAIILQQGGNRRVEPGPIGVLPPSVPPVEVDGSQPTLLAYQRALARSPEALDALLNKDARVAPQSSPELVRVCAFTWSDAELHALLGGD